MASIENFAVAHGEKSRARESRVCQDRHAFHAARSKTVSGNELGARELISPGRIKGYY